MRDGKIVTENPRPACAHSPRDFGDQINFQMVRHSGDKIRSFDRKSQQERIEVLDMLMDVKRQCEEEDMNERSREDGRWIVRNAEKQWAKDEKIERENGSAMVVL